MSTLLKRQAKPFLKWAGGKGQLISQIREYLPKEILITGKIDKYFEPFVGGGAVFFWLAEEFDIGRAYLYDINPEIVHAYKVIKSHVQKLVHILEKLEHDYYRRTKLQRETFYYEKRDAYNRFIERNSPEEVLERVAHMIFLNKTCFNGLFRVNSSGAFNVPFGRYEAPTICDFENLLAVRHALKHAEIECRDFAYCLEKADANSLVYFDPPYRPLTRTANFTSYIKDGFDDDNQRRLKDVVDSLDKIGAKVVLSNSDPKNVDPKDNFFDVLYRSYRIKRLQATRMINCNADRRGEIKEILVMN